MSDDLLAAALAFVGEGLPVFPCEPRGKRPLVEGGFKSASLAEGQVRAWWSARRLANIGIPTGAVSGIVVLDIDPGGDASLAALVGQRGSLPETRVVRTGRGRQLWFKHPGVPVGCSAGVLGQGLDFRGDGGYVITPPSIHPNGQRYTFQGDRDLAEMPDWLVRLTVQAKAQTIPNNETGGRIPHGKRNATLTAIAGSLRRLGLPETEILETLRGINSRQCDPPLPEGEVCSIGASVAKYPPSAVPSPSSTRPDGFSLVGLGELLARPETPVDWVWQDRLAAGTVSGVFSKPKVGKSTFARNLCLAVARGADFLGLPVKKGLCIYLALEERVEDVMADFRAMGATGDEPILIHADTTPEAGVLALIDLVRERKPVSVYIDPLFRMIQVKDEKAYAEGYKALGPLIDVARSTGTHILVTHHSGKALKADAIDAPLGSTAIGGAVSTLIVLKRTEAYRTIQTVQRIGPEMPETILQFDPEPRRLSVGRTRFQADQAEGEEAILEFLKTARQGKTEKEIDHRVEGKTALKRKALRGLVEKGRVTREESGKRGDPYKYSFPCSKDVSGTREQETENGRAPRINTEGKLVPENYRDPILVPEASQAQDLASAAVETPVLEGEF